LIKILHIVPNLGHGGAEHQLAANVAALDSSRFQSYVCHLHRADILANSIRADGIPVSSAYREGRTGWIKRLLFIRKLINELDIDIVHGSNVEGEIYAGLAGRLTGRAVVSTLTNIAYEPVWLQDNPNLTSWKLRVVANARKLVLRKTHHRIVAISEHVKTSAIEGFGLKSDTVSVIYRGMSQTENSPTEQSLDSLRAELDLKSCPFVVLNVGRLVPQKGQRYLLDAFAEVLREIPDARLLIAGVGFLESDLKQRTADLGIADNVNFLGRRDDVPNLLKIADVFAFPSLFEGLGVTLLEASHAGTACVASNVGPIPEIVVQGKTGLLVESANVGKWTRALLALARDPQARKQMGEKARERIGTYFSIENSAKRLETLYLDMVHKR
jgi:glycosyltransferase involved in cell wall biosynthesis